MVDAYKYNICINDVLVVVTFMTNIDRPIELNRTGYATLTDSPSIASRFPPVSPSSAVPLGKP